MATDRELLAEIDRAFGDAPRPEHFADYAHCCECFEHDELLRSRDRETLGIDDVGSPAWDPICFITPEGFAYYLPALARLALSEPDERWGWYGDQLAFHLRLDGPRNARWLYCTGEQRRAVARLLDHVLETRAELAHRDDCADALFEAHEIWSENDGVEETMTDATKEHTYAIETQWTGNDGAGTAAYRAYRRDHEISAAGKSPIPASSDPAFRGDRTRYNPEELLVASLSSCHMLWYLHLCADAGVVVTSYVDAAIGRMTETPDGGGRFTSVELRPRVEIAAGSDAARARELHERAHGLCFIASSVNFPVTCAPEIVARP